MSNIIKGYAATAAKAPLSLHEFDAGPLGDEHVEIAVTHCGICHSDLSMGAVERLDRTGSEAMIPASPFPEKE